MRTAILLAVLLPAAAARGQAFTWTGGGVTDGWSDAANWDAGAPTSGDGVTLVAPRGTNDLPGLSVGTLTGDFGWGGERLTVTRAATFEHDAAADFDQQPARSPVRFADGVRLEATGFPFDGEFRRGVVPQFNDAVHDGDLTISGGFRVDSLGGTGGTLRVEADGAFTTAGTFDSAVVEGVITQGRLDLGGTGTLDATSGLVAAASAVNTLGVAHPLTLTVDGNLKLGRWANGGPGSESLFGPNSGGNFDYQVAERIDVAGTLDLTRASLLYGSIRREYDSGSGDVSVPPPELPASFVLAEYGNRVGRFPQESFGVFLDDTGRDRDIFVPGRIAYTNGENAGPGRIVVLLPEPAASAGLLACGLLLRRRK